MRVDIPKGMSGIKFGGGRRVTLQRVRGGSQNHGCHAVSDSRIDGCLTEVHTPPHTFQIATNKRYAGNTGWTVSEVAERVAKDIGKIDIVVGGGKHIDVVVVGGEWIDIVVVGGERIDIVESGGEWKSKSLIDAAEGFLQGVFSRGFPGLGMKESHPTLLRFTLWPMAPRSSSPCSRPPAR